MIVIFQNTYQGLWRSLTHREVRGAADQAIVDSEDGVDRPRRAPRRFRSMAAPNAAPR